MKQAASGRRKGSSLGFYFNICSHPRLPWWVVTYLKTSVVDSRTENIEQNWEPVPSHRRALCVLLFPLPQAKKHTPAQTSDLRRPQTCWSGLCSQLPEFKAWPCPQLSHLWNGLNNGSCSLGLLGGLLETSKLRMQHIIYTQKNIRLVLIQWSFLRFII